MNLYKFKKQINLVFSQKPTLNIHIQSGEKIRCIGYLNKQALADDFIKTLPHGDIFLVYTLDSNKYNFITADITESKNYIHMLNDEKINLKADVNYTPIFDKAIKLFGKMHCDKKAFFSTSVQILNSYYLKDGIEDSPILTTLDDMPLNHEIFYAEAKYFIKKYMKFNLTNNQKEHKNNGVDFDNLFLTYLKNWFRL